MVRYQRYAVSFRSNHLVSFLIKASTSNPWLSVSPVGCIPERRLCASTPLSLRDHLSLTCDLSFPPPPFNREIIKHLDISWGTIIHQSSFYIEDKLKDSTFNPESPDSFDWDAMAETITRIKEGKSVKIKKFDSSKKVFVNTVEVNGADVILCIGTMLLTNKNVADLLNIKIFVDSEDDERLMNARMFLFFSFLLLLLLFSSFLIFILFTFLFN